MTDVHFLKGTRLYLRELRESDVNDDYYRWMNDSETGRYMNHRFFPQSKEGILRYMQAHSGTNNEVMFAFCLLENDRHIGNGKLGPIDWINRHGEVSLLIGEKDCWGKGYATEGIGLIVQYAFQRLGLHRLNAGMYTANLGSKRAFEKNGFQLEGTRKDFAYSSEGWQDAYMMGLIRPQYEAFLLERKND